MRIYLSKHDLYKDGKVTTLWWIREVDRNDNLGPEVKAVYHDNQISLGNRNEIIRNSISN